MGGLRLILEMERGALRVVGVSFDIWRWGILFVIRKSLRVSFEERVEKFTCHLRLIF